MSRRWDGKVVGSPSGRILRSTPYQSCTMIFHVYLLSDLFMLVSVQKCLTILDIFRLQKHFLKKHLKENMNQNHAGIDKSTCLLAPASDFLKKGFLGKYIYDFNCPSGQADSLNTIHIFI